MKTKFVLIATMISVASYGLFASCEKETNRETSKLINYETMNNWIGSSEPDVSDQLLQMGFQVESIDNIGYCYSKKDQTCIQTCILQTTDSNVWGVIDNLTPTDQTFEYSFDIFKRLVTQEQQLFEGLEHFYGRGSFAWDDTDDEGVDGEVSYDSFAEMTSSTFNHNHLGWQIQWTDVYEDSLQNIFRAEASIVFGDWQGLDGGLWMYWQLTKVAY